MPINETAANEAALTRLCDSLTEERVIAVMGAGTSNWAGYDTWDSVLGRLAEEVTAMMGNPAIATDIRRLNENKLHQAQKLGDKIGNVAFQAFIRREFALPGRPVHHIIKNLVRLPLSHFLTLNFDRSGELAHDALGLLYRTLSTADPQAQLAFLADCHVPNALRMILHLHGLFTDPIANIALHYQRYNALYKDTHLKKLIWSVWMTRPLLFVGFSFTDEFFCGQLKECADDVRHDLGINAANRHFAILPLPFAGQHDDRIIRQTMVNDYLIDAVFYETRDGATSLERHAGFAELIAEIGTRLGIAPVAVAMPAPLPAPVALSADDENRRRALVNEMLTRAEREREQ